MGELSDSSSPIIIRGNASDTRTVSRESPTHSSRRSTAPRGAAASVGQESLGIFRRIRETIVRRAQVWTNLHGEWIHFCPHALGWPGDEASVQALALQERREDVIEGGTWHWLPNFAGQLRRGAGLRARS